MSIDVKQHGRYEIFKTTEDHRILVLDDKQYYALVQGQQGPVIIKSDADHQKDQTTDKGEYVLFTAHDDPDWNDDVAHLELQQSDERYKTCILPEGLPTEKDYQKKFVESDETVPASKVPKVTAK